MKIYEVCLESSNGMYNAFDGELFLTELSACREAHGLIIDVNRSDKMQGFTPIDGNGMNVKEFIEAVLNEINEFNEWWSACGNYYLALMEKEVES